MTLEKAFYALMLGAQGILEAFDNCVLYINDTVSMSLTDMFIGVAIAGVVIGFIKVFSLGS